MSIKSLNYETKTLYKNFLGFITKKGNKTKAKIILDRVFLIVSRTTGLSMHVCMLKLFINLNSFVEVKKVRIGRKSLLVPFSISLKRRSYLIVKWLMQVIKNDKKKIELSSRLAEEVLSVLRDTNSRSKKLRDLNLSQALSNRSNIHYRW
ncbi:MAG: Ribosomal protein S7p/S5e [Bacteroidota bacterium]|jgi:ribosomal protein S7